MDINDPGKSWKMHIKKVLESRGKPLSVFCMHPDKYAVYTSQNVACTDHILDVVDTVLHSYYVVVHYCQLVGIVKLSLHQFYMSYRDRKVSAALLRAQVPFVC